jgi:RNA polymerase sigma-70 factor (ECF subfamily)
VEKVFLESRGDVYYYLLTLGLAPPVAQEIVQEVFLKLYLAMRDGPKIEHPRAWVFRVAHNLGLNLRAGERRLEPLPETVSPASPARNPEEALAAKQRDERLLAAVAELSPQQRQCLHLRAEGLRYHEIAATLGVSVSTVNEFVRRAIRKLKRVVHA